MSSVSGLAIIDDKDQAIRYSSFKWFDGRSDRQFNGTCKFSKVAGENATLSFSGTSITAYGSIYTIANSTMTFQLDNDSNFDGSYNTTASPTPAYLHHQVFWKSPELNDTEHILVFKQENNSTDGQDAVICLDFFTYVPSRSAITTNTNYLVDDQDSRVKYTGGWTTTSGERSELMNQTGMFTSEQDTMFEFEFEGTGITAFGALYSNVTESIWAEFKLDDGNAGTNSTATFAPATPTADIYNQQIFQARNLPRSNHKLTGTLKNSGLLIVDYFLVEPGDPNETQASKSTGRRAPARGAIAGGVVGGIVALLLILTIFFWWRRRRNRKEMEAVGADHITPYPAANTANTDSNSNVLSPLRMEQVQGHTPLSTKRSRLKESEAAHFDLASVQVPVYVSTTASGSESAGTASIYSPYSSNTPLSPLQSSGELEGHRSLPDLPDSNQRRLAEHIDSGLRFREGDSLPPPRYTQN
ncbi:hypothetical protein L218DRAFT_102541 [Marasmius fiardii PR-910]|nr:hypothetical protein L218DRAFT_102541 [Marasmius fiardii PR-910]